MKGLSKRTISGLRALTCTIFALPLAFALGEGTAQGAAITLSDANSSMVLDLGAANMSSWTVDGVNQVVNQSFFIGINGNAEIPLTALTSSPIGSQANARQYTAQWANNLAAVRISWQLGGYSAGSGSSGYTENVRLYNYTTAPMTVRFFQYSDFNLGGIAGNQYAKLTTDASGYTEVVQTLGNANLALASGYFSEVASPSANGAETDMAGLTLTKLTDGVASSLSGASPAGPGNFDWALQWDITIPAGASVPLLLNGTLQVPEPSSISLLLLGLGGFAVLRRRAS